MSDDASDDTVAELEQWVLRVQLKTLGLGKKRLKRDASDEELVRLGENARKRLDAWRP